MNNDTDSFMPTASQSDDDENLRKLLETCTEINASSAGETSCDENLQIKRKMDANSAENAFGNEEKHENEIINDEGQMAESFLSGTPDNPGTPPNTTRTPVQRVTTKGRGKGKSKELTEEEIERLKIPLEVFGWRRELVYRQTGHCDVYYYDPVDAKKLRSVPELKKFLAENEITELTAENFSFGRFALNTENEVVRPALGRPGAPGASSSTTTSPSVKKQQAKKPPAHTALATVTAITVEEPLDKSFENESSRSSIIDASVLEKLDELPTAMAVDEKTSESRPESRSPPLQEQGNDLNDENQIIERMEHLIADASQELSALPDRAGAGAVESVSKKRLISPTSGKTTSASPKRRKIVDSSAATGKVKSKTVGGKKSAKKAKKVKVDGSKAVRKALSRLDDSIEEDESREEDEEEQEKDRKREEISKKEDENGEKVGQESEDEVSKMDSSRENESTTHTEAESSAVEEIRRTAEDSVNDITANNTDDSDLASNRKDLKPRQIQGPGVSSECETAICDNRDTHDTVCASCLLEFHLVCASKRGRLVETAKDSYFICNACYHNYTQGSGIKVISNNNTKEAIARQIVALVGKQQEKPDLGGSEAVLRGGRTGATWIADACTYYQLLKMIFKHLIAVDLLKARLVCKTWNDACMTSDFWRIASLKGCQIREWSKAASFLRERRVQILDFFGVKTSVQAFTVSLKDMDYLTGLHFGHVVPLVLYAIKDCTRVLSKLENLRFTVTEQRRPDKISEINVNFELFRHTINLQHLRVMAGKFFELKIVNLNYLQTLSRLTNLTLLDVKIDDLTEWQFLKKLQNLQCLRIGSCANWNSKTYEIISNLKNLEKLRLEIGETIPHDYLSQTLVALPKLKELCLVKFSINRVIMDLIASKKLVTLMIWPDFGSKNAIPTWRHMVDGLAKQKSMKNFVLGVASKELTVSRDGGPIPEQQTLEKGQVPVKFAYEKDLTGSLKMIFLDDFLRYAKKYVPNVYNFYFKDDNVSCTRVF